MKTIETEADSIIVASLLMFLLGLILFGWK